jgi:hypothetical protein
MALRKSGRLYGCTCDAPLRSCLRVARLNCTYKSRSLVFHPTESSENTPRKLLHE